jgi:hypothetical protein
MSKNFFLICIVKILILVNFISDMKIHDICDKCWSFEKCFLLFDETTLQLLNDELKSISQVHKTSAI